MSKDELTIPQPPFEPEHAQINDNIRFLADVRFKLLALLPVLGGAALFVLARIGLEAGKPAAASTGKLLVVVLVSAFGVLATLRITPLRPAQPGTLPRPHSPRKVSGEGIRAANRAGITNDNWRSS